MSGLFKGSSIARKISMALSALFLMVFLLQHLLINFSSVLSADMFNSLSHFMGTNPVVQFIFQPILMFGVVFHFVMGFILEIQNAKARPVKYAFEKASANASIYSRFMIYSGGAILLFLVFHLKDFWIHEMNVKYINPIAEDPTRYYHEMTEMFIDPIRVGVYCLAFVFLALHLWHGFQSAFQSLGARHPKYTPVIQTLGKYYAILVPAAYVFIALFHHYNH